MENDLGHIVYSKNILEFVTVAGEFCNFIENCNNIEKKQFLMTAQKLLPLLYLKGSLIPELDIECDDPVEKYVTEELWKGVEESVKIRLGKNNDYFEVFDPGIEYSETPVSASISENMADIYQDIKDFLILYRIGTTEIMNDGLYDCKQHFEQYWGQKLLNALRAIHNIIYSIDGIENDENSKIYEENDVSSDKVNTSNWILSRMQQQYGNDEEKDK